VAVPYKAGATKKAATTPIPLNACERDASLGRSAESRTRNGSN
jgi:hypothetical protein